MNKSKFIVLHEVHEKGIMRFVRQVDFISMVMGADDVSSQVEIDVPRGSNAYITFVDGTGYFVEETLEEITTRLDSNHLVLK